MAAEDARKVPRNEQQAKDEVRVVLGDICAGVLVYEAFGMLSQSVEERWVGKHASITKGTLQEDLVHAIVSLPCDMVPHTVIREHHQQTISLAKYCSYHRRGLLCRRLLFFVGAAAAVVCLLRK